MDRAIVLVDSIDGIDWLVSEAGELAAGVGAELLLLHVRSESDYEEDRQAVESALAAESLSYDVGQAAEGAERFAAEVAERALEGIDVEYETLGAIGDRDDQLLRVARERGCDHVFLSGRRRSPSGKAIFGDAAQQVILNFEGPVTTVTHPLSEL